MPPRKQPKTLQELSLKTVASLTNELCVSIERKHGDWKCQASRDELEIGKTYLSSIRPLVDDLWRVVLDLFLEGSTLAGGVGVKYMLLELLLCDRLSTVCFDGKYHSFFTDPVFWENQLLKLTNVLELDIREVELTDESFQAIGDVCTNVRKLCVRSDLKCASMQSLKHVLKCQELRDVRIDFWHWEADCISEYVIMLVAGLPNLEHFHNWLKWDMNGAMSRAKLVTSMRKCFKLDMSGAMPLTKPVSSMRKLECRNIKPSELAAIIRLCPNLTDLELAIGFWRDSTRSIAKGDKVLKVLAKSSLQLKTLTLTEFVFSQEITRVITSRCANLTSLVLNGYEGTKLSVNEIHTIGVSCPKIVELRISNSVFDWDPRFSNMRSNFPDVEKYTSVATPRMFVCLKVLYLGSSVDWDQRILPLILRHADNLTSISLQNVFKPSNTSVDPLSQILNSNALQELESLHINANWYSPKYLRSMPSIPKASIERLLDGCHKLCKLYLSCKMDDETEEYLKNQQSYMESENFDLSFAFFLP